MSFYTGTHGRVEIRKGNDQTKADQETPQLFVRNWQITTSIAQLDATTLADTDKVPVNGIRTTRGSCQILMYAESGKDSSIKELANKLVKARNDSDINTKNPGQAAEAQEVWLYLYIDTDGDSKKGYKLMVNLTSFSIACAVGEIVSANFQFESIGAPLEWNS